MAHLAAGVERTHAAISNQDAGLVGMQGGHDACQVMTAQLPEEPSCHLFFAAKRLRHDVQLHWLCAVELPQERLQQDIPAFSSFPLEDGHEYCKSHDTWQQP